MSLKPLLPSLYELRLGLVNAFLIDDPAGAVLIDTGYPGQADRIVKGLNGAGKEAQDVRDILVTHCHGDHSGSAAEMKRRTGARLAMHPLDADMVRRGKTQRPWAPTPGLFNRALYELFVKPAPKQIEPTETDVELDDGQLLPVAGGLRVVHAPGHCAGQTALLWQRHGGVLFSGDAAMNTPWLRPAIVYEDLELGLATLAKLAALPFEHACFGHGRPMLGGAAQRLRLRFGRAEI